MGIRKVTTISLLEKLYKQAKRKAKQEGKTFSGYLADLILKDQRVK